jgi:protein SCO1/2/putative membrane protein
MKRVLPWVLVGGVALCAAAAIGSLLVERPGGERRRLPDFRLQERGGGTLSKRDLLGEVWVGEFVFTRCAGACPVMVSRTFATWKKFPQVKYVFFTADPEHDRPEVLAAYAKNNSLPGEWRFCTGSYGEMQSLAKDGFQLSMGPGSDPKEPVIHSDRFVVMDRYGRIVKAVSVAEEGALAEVEALLGAVTAERALPVKAAPVLNACLNGACTVCLCLGLALVKAKRPGAHQACMVTALALSAVFLASYLGSHYFVGSTKYRGEGGLRLLYFGILLTHTVLAALVVPLAGATVFLAAKGTFDRHRAWARWTFPIWLYVSVTGVLIYFILYP